MTREEVLTAFEMKYNGFTYDEIGEHLNYTGANIHRELHRVLSNKPISTDGSLYPNLTKEIKLRYKSVRNFCKEKGVNYPHLANILRGITKATIDDIELYCNLFNKDYNYLFQRRDSDEC